jgi:hypothetical protein
MPKVTDQRSDVQHLADVGPAWSVLCSLKREQSVSSAYTAEVSQQIILYRFENGLTLSGTSPTWVRVTSSHVLRVLR